MVKPLPNPNLRRTPFCGARDLTNGAIGCSAELLGSSVCHPMLLLLDVESPSKFEEYGLTLEVRCSPIALSENLFG